MSVPDEKTSGDEFRSSVTETQRELVRTIESGEAFSTIRNLTTVVEEQREELVLAMECEKALLAKCDKLNRENIRLRSQLMAVAFTAKEAAKQGAEE